MLTASISQLMMITPNLKHLMIKTPLMIAAVIAVAARMNGYITCYPGTPQAYDIIVERHLLERIPADVARLVKVR